MDKTDSNKSVVDDRPPDFAKQAPFSSVYGSLDYEAPIHRLPAEVLLKIASKTTPCSRACLALSSKRLFCVISDGFSTVFDDLRLPAELPQERQPYSIANDWPLMYQPDRWNFLCLLQKDSQQWLACSDCFVLHPARWFGQTHVAVWPLQRSWPQCRPPKLDHLPRKKVPRGVVDLCPCIKLTPSKKRILVAYLQRQHQEQGNQSLRGTGTSLPPDNGPWWHECQATHAMGVVKTKIHPYLHENGELGVITGYTNNQILNTKNLNNALPLLRLLCPHGFYSRWCGDLYDYHDEPRFNIPCRKCARLRQCRYCSTRVISWTKARKLESSCLFTLSTERILSDHYWNRQIIFPFPRYTQLLYPKSRDREPGNTIAESFSRYKRWRLNSRSVLASGWHR